MRKTFLLLPVLFFLHFVLLAQQTGKTNLVNPFVEVQERKGDQGQISIRQSQAIEQSLLLFVEMNQNSPGVEGYRVQIYSGTGSKARQEAQNVRGKLLSSFPNEKVTVEYKAPFWNVRVGYFRHKHESLLLLRKLRGIFPNSYAVRDSGIKPEYFE